jgi:hypothetical protein
MIEIQHENIPEWHQSIMIVPQCAPIVSFNPLLNGSATSIGSTDRSSLRKVQFLHSYFFVQVLDADWHSSIRGPA